MTPLEKAARVLLKAQDGLPAEKPADWSEEMWLEEQWLQQTIEDATWFKFVDDVRAVLTAIREPSDGMAEAGQTYLDGAKWDQAIPEARDAWEIMIDALLAETE